MVHIHMYYPQSMKLQDMLVSGYLIELLHFHNTCTHHIYMEWPQGWVCCSGLIQCKAAVHVPHAFGYLVGCHIVSCHSLLAPPLLSLGAES